MPYVQRDTNGAVIGVFANPQPDYAAEWLDDDDPAIATFQATLARARLDAMSVSAFQAQAAMAIAQAKGITDFDLLAKVQQIVSAAPDPMVQIAWNKAAEFRRDSPTILALAASVPLTSDQLDQLFELAATISA
jgi:poly-gamma-glutamate capsule biosynthesis protein CapA/YwtB (metallophosphatase superfamily)